MAFAELNVLFIFVDFSASSVFLDASGSISITDLATLIVALSTPLLVIREWAGGLGVMVRVKHNPFVTFAVANPAVESSL